MLVAGVGAGTLLPAVGSFTELAPPLFPMTGLLTAAAVIVVFFGYYQLRGRTRVKSAALLRKSLVCMAIALLVFITYNIAFGFWTVQPPDGSDASIRQIGFGRAEWSLTNDARQLMSEPPEGLDIRTTGDLMLAFGVWGGIGQVTDVWTPPTVIAAGSILIALFVVSFLLWAYAWASLARFVTIHGGPPQSSDPPKPPDQ